MNIISYLRIYTPLFPRKTTFCCVFKYKSILNVPRSNNEWSVIYFRRCEHKTVLNIPFYNIRDSLKYMRVVHIFWYLVNSMHAFICNGTIRRNCILVAQICQNLHWKQNKLYGMQCVKNCNIAYKTTHCFILCV